MKNYLKNGTLFENDKPSGSVARADDSENVAGKEFQPRDGGWGWVVCVTAFWANGTIIGLHKTFGVLYIEFLDMYKDYPGGNVVIKAAFIGSAAVGVLFASAVFTSAVASVIGIRQGAALGVILSCTGLIASSYVHTLEYYYLTYSVLIGVGTSFIFTAQMMILVHYFKRHLGMVNGIATLGGSVFSIFQPFVVSFCLKNSGIAAALRVQAGLMGIIILCATTWKEQIPKQKKMLDRDKRTSLIRILTENCACANRGLLQNRRYLLFCLCVALAELTQFIPFVHLVNHARITMPGENGKILLTCAAASSALSRVLFGRISDAGWSSKIRIYQFGALALGIGTMVVPFASRLPLLGFISCVIGAAEGAIVVMKVPALVDLVGVSNAGQAVGMTITVSAVPQMIGPLLAGWIYDLTGTYTLAFYAAGTPSLLSACLLFTVISMGQRVVERFQKSILLRDEIIDDK